MAVGHRRRRRESVLDRPEHGGRLAADGDEELSDA
jgi:hypothetical protein